MAPREKTNKLILTGLLMALTTVATMAIAIPVPFTNGYIHLGDSMIFVSVLVLGWRYGAIAAGVGSAMADVFLGYVHWAPWTLVIKGLMAVLMGLLIEKTAGSRKNTTLAVALIGVVWLGFHFTVQRIVAWQNAVDPSALYSEEVADPSALAAFLSQIQTQLMVAALLLPALLVLIAWLVRKKEHYNLPFSQVMGMTLAGFVMVFGYYIAGGVMYGNFAVSAFAIPANMIQFVVGFLVAALLVAALSKTPAEKYFVLGRKKFAHRSPSFSK